jgi:putative ABC transport system permease protein
MIPVSYNVRSLFVRKATTIATALGIGLVVFVLASSWMLSEGIKRTLNTTGSTDNAIVLRKGSDAELSSSIENKHASVIMALPGVKVDETGSPMAVAEVIVVIALEKTGTDGKVSNVSVRGVPDNVLKMRSEARIVSGRPAQPGTDEVIIGTRIEGRFAGMKIGKTFELKKNRPVTVVGVFSAAGSAFESEVWADIDTVRTSFGREGHYSSVTVKLDATSKLEQFTASVENEKQIGLEASSEREYYEKQSEGMSIFILAMGVIISLFLSIGAMIGAMITMYAAVAQRTREIGTLRALGFSRLSIMFSFLFESFILALVGGIIGSLAAIAMGMVHFSMMNFVTWSEIVFTFEPTPKILITSAVIGGVMGIFGGFFPALRASRTSPIEAMRG